jgi:osmoprotectant transport system permease protein
VLALVFYCVMPVLRGTIAGIEAVPGEARQAARAMGFTRWQLIWSIDVPLALPLISDAVRVALVLAVATAAIGALAGAATLGTPIITGLQNQKRAAHPAGRGSDRRPRVHGRGGVASRP